jgi:tRNA pseudouridine55 synthase
MITGFVNVDKPAGMTSHDVVDSVRRVAGQRQVGHTGTLDPFATGVLVLALGKATRLASFLTGADKAYQGQITLGRATTTDDVEGETTAEGPVDHLDPEGVGAAMHRFLGTIQQMPPPFSAKKVAGKKLYQYARAGEQVQVEPKTVTVHQFVLDRWEPPILHFRAVVSTGTYVRSLAHDLGLLLGCGGHLSQLARIQVGRFRLEEATPLASLENDPGLLREKLSSIPDSLPDIPTVTVSEEAKRRLLNGSPAAVEERGVGLAAAAAERLLALDEAGHVLALVEKVPASVGTLRFQPKILLTGV